MVSDELKSSKANFIDFGVVVARCKRLISLSTNFSVRFIRRQANGVAHSLARASVFNASSWIFYIATTCIADVIMNEMS